MCHYKESGQDSKTISPIRVFTTCIRDSPSRTKTYWAMQRRVWKALLPHKTTLCHERSFPTARVKGEKSQADLNAFKLVSITPGAVSRSC